MKKICLMILLGMITSSFVSCCFLGGSSIHPDLVGNDPKGGTIHFFQFRDTSYLNKIIVWKDPVEHFNENFLNKYGEILGFNKYFIPLFPKNLEGQPMFGENASGTNWDFMFMNGDFYTLDDLLDSPKFIALKGGYYICYPFTALELHGHYIDAEWKDFHKTKFYKAEILTHSPYKVRYSISERTLANLTKKSTEHFKRENAERITIDDIVATLNMLIETNSITEYCYKVYN